MERDEEIRDLMAKLMQAVEASLSTSSAVREALAELVRQGYEARLFFVANAEGDEPDDEGASDAAEDADDDEDEPLVLREIAAAPETGSRAFELTRLDCEFLKSVHIRPESA